MITQPFQWYLLFTRKGVKSANINGREVYMYAIVSNHEFSSIQRWKPCYIEVSGLNLKGAWKLSGMKQSLTYEVYVISTWFSGLFDRASVKWSPSLCSDFTVWSWARERGPSSFVTILLQRLRKASKAAIVVHFKWPSTFSFSAVNI